MKNIFLSLIILTLGITSCSKEDKECNVDETNFIAPTSETNSVQAYLSAAGITDAQLHPSGFYYKITQVGTGKAVVNLCSNINIKYVGKLTNGNIFDQTPAGESRIFSLGGLILGWQKGVPLISSGGKITLYLPPSLAYGSAPQNGIPGNSILVFDIELINVT